jgi:hypothetical protein
MEDERFHLNDKMRVDQNAHKIGKSPFQIEFEYEFFICYC